MNHSSNFSNSSLADAFFIASGVLHILLVIIPVILIGPVVLWIFLSDKKLRDPVSVLYICSSLMCVLGPLIYGLPMDLSLITGVEFFGSCESSVPKLFWFLFSTIQLHLLATNALVSVVLYVSVRVTDKKLTSRVTLIILFVLFGIVLLGNTVHFIGPGEIKLRGSLCRHPGPRVPYAGHIVPWYTYLVFILPPIIVVCVFSILTVQYVKKNTVSNGPIVKSVVKAVLVWTGSVMLFRSISAVCLLTTYGLYPIGEIELGWIVTWYGLYIIELSNPLFLLLPLFLHKTVKKHFKQKWIGRVTGCWSKLKEGSQTNRVTPV